MELFWMAKKFHLKKSFHNKVGADKNCRGFSIFTQYYPQ